MIAQFLTLLSLIAYGMGVAIILYSALLGTLAITPFKRI